MIQLYRNLIASGIVLQLAILDVYFMLKADAGSGAWWKFILYALFFAVIHFPANGRRVFSSFRNGVKSE
jgi:hypothetical protein